MSAETALIVAFGIIAGGGVVVGGLLIWLRKRSSDNSHRNELSHI